MSTTVYCKLQNRLGAIDRVLAAFTHRGILPTRMTTTMDEADRSMEIAISFDGSDPKTVEKLVKFLQKQVYVLETGMFSHETQSAAQEQATAVSLPFSTPSPVPVAISQARSRMSSLNSSVSSPSKFSEVQFVERKIAHANNA
jgi:acetolactate synthase regulatory subunit